MVVVRDAAPANPVVEEVELGGVVVLEVVVVAAAPATRVVLAPCFLPQSLLAASARLPFGCEDTYSPWFRAFSHVMTGLIATPPGLVLLVVAAGVVDEVVDEAPITTTPTIVDPLCAVAFQRK